MRIRPDGNLLVSNFLAAVTNIVTAKTAEIAAKRSEQDTLLTIESLNTANGLYVTPEDIPTDIKDRLVRESLDAHLKKAQSEQISHAAIGQMKLLEQQTIKEFQGKKVIVRVLDHSARPLEGVWYDPKANKFTSQVMKTTQVRGIIKEIRLNQNVLILIPTITTRLMWPKQQNFVVYVVNPNTLQPAVTINVL